jgi:DNA adenine methylase
MSNELQCSVVIKKKKRLRVVEKKPDILNEMTYTYPITLVKEAAPKMLEIEKPILKWVGGKTQIIDKLIAEFPTEINNYHETFLGGGSVLLVLLKYIKAGKIKLRGKINAYDLNEPLIWVYKNIQSSHIDLYNKLQLLINDFNGCGEGPINRNPTTIEDAKQSKENYFYWVRKLYNKLSSVEKTTTLGSSMFIFMNKTCFRGVFRVGPNGFNVPYGHYNKPEIVNREHLERVHLLIKDVLFECRDFNTSLLNVKPGDYVYLDPPYAPETEKSFVGYTENGFDKECHETLFKKLHELTEQKIKIMMSNADVELVRNSFTNEKYNTVSIMCKRSINSKNPEAKTREVIIKNY